MSLGTYTKCNLSADIAVIDLTILTKQVELRFYSLVNEIKTTTEKILHDTLKTDNRKENVFSMSVTGSNKLIELTKNLAETTELLHTLQETEEREIEIIKA